MKRSLLIYCLLFNFSIGLSQTAGDYRTKASGTWGTAANWEMYNGSAWVAAGAAPNSTNGVITVNHAMTINATITLDQVIVSSTGSIAVSGLPVITIADGTGTDFLNNGTVNFAARPIIVNGQFENNGTHTSTTGAFTVAGSYTNNATGILNIGPLTCNGVFVNNGTVTTNGAVNAASATSNLTNNGTWTISSTSTFTLNNATAAFTNAASGTLNNNGTITLTNGSFSTSGTLNNYNLFINNLASITMTTPITNQINSTFRYSRNGNQTVYEIPYWHLELGGSAGTNTKTLTLTNNYSLSGNLTLLPVAANCIFEILGSYNFNISGTVNVGANGKIQPSATTVLNGLGGTMNIANLGEIRVTNVDPTPLTNQYQNFVWTGVADSGIVNYFANGTQIIEETLPGGVPYGGLTITSSGVALNKNLTLTANRTIRGNLIVNSTTVTGLLELHGSGTLQVGGRVDITNYGLVDVLPSVTIQATGTNSYMSIGANTQIRITQYKFTDQYQNFKYVTCNGFSTQIFYSNNAQLVEALPTDGPLRSYGNLRLVGDRGANDITFQPTNIGIVGSFRDSTQYTTGNIIFTGSNIIFLNTSAMTSHAPNRYLEFDNLTFSGTATHTWISYIKVNGDLTINSGASISFSISTSPIGITVLGNTFISQSTSSLAVNKIHSNTAVRLEFNHITLSGDASMVAIGSTPIVRALIQGNVTNNNTSATTVLASNTIFTHFITSSSLATIGGAMPVVVSYRTRMSGNWQLTNHLVLNSATVQDFYLNNATLSLNSFQLVASGATHNLDYLPSNVTMPPATDPFCSHPQVINWNCVKAETIYVATTGNNANNGLTPATAVRDMRVAVNKVAYGGVIMVANGTYTEIFALKKKIKIHGQSNTNTIFQAPTGLSAPSPSCAVSQQNDSAIVYFDTFSDSSYLYNVKIVHNVSRIRRGAAIKSNVTGIIVDNNTFEGTVDLIFGFPNVPTYYDCPDLVINANNKVYSIQAEENSTFDIKNNTFIGFSRRTIGGNESGNLFTTSYVRNNYINNTASIGGEQAIWFYYSTNIEILNNTVLGTSLSYGIDISSVRSIGFNKGYMLVKNNTVNVTTTVESQCVAKECLNYGTVIFDGNTITTGNGSFGIKAQASRDVIITNNIFNSAGTSFCHILIDNLSPGGIGFASGTEIYGNTFNSGTSTGGTAIRALRTGSPDYNRLLLNGTSLGYNSNIFTANCLYFLNLTQNLGPNADSIDMTQGNTFPLGGAFDYYRVEQRIIHRMDDARGGSSPAYPRPIVFVIPRNYFVCTEYTTGGIDVPVIPEDNRSIQDGIDFAAAHDTINVQFGTFAYPSGSEYENTVNFNKPLSFRSNNNGGFPIIDRNFQVNLPSASDSVTQYNNFYFSDGFVESLSFDVNQGDWVLNGGVITFANANATLNEMLNQTIRGYTGWIQTTRNIGAPTSLNVAGFGAEITSAVNMGTTTIRRGHWEQTLPAGYRSILRVFNISPTTNSGLNATFRFRYDPSELLPIHTPANLKQFRNANNFSPWHNGYNIAPYTLQGGTGASYYVDLSGINAFSSWTLGEATPLPVELLTFNATLVNQNSVRLDWNVANEINLSHYEIEKSYDLATFNKIGDNVNATGQPHYLGWDYQPKLGVNYYRLKMVDLDGSYKYSEIRTVVIDPANELSLLVYPNPFNDNLQVSLAGVDKLPCDIVITDAIGRTVYSQHIHEWNGNTSINLTSLSSGVYYLKLQVGDKSIGTKLVKN
ncbi:MAG: hypothetical protein KatS3mg035_1516 [Bacteroidia bacterium]|nr:MAG: hypothetical protein KatS3mg035_1516 [Bacteroidia bacterium]